MQDTLHTVLEENIATLKQLLPIGSGWLPKFRIDMVFHSDGLRTLSYRRIKTRMSDHYPVLTAVELEN